MENKNYVVAIDLGTSSVVVVAGTKGAEGKLHIDACAVRGTEGMTRGEIRNIEQVAGSIKGAVSEIEEKLGVRISEAFTGISGQHIECTKNSYYVPVGRDNEIRNEDVNRLGDNMRNIQAPEGRKILERLPQNYVIDGSDEVSDPVGMFGSRLEGTFNFILGDGAITSRHEKALSRLGIRQTKMFLNPLVAAEAVVLPDEKELGVAVLDIGAGTTDVCIFHNEVMCYLGVIPIGADTINKDIRSYGILERYVEELKVNFGTAIADKASSSVIKVPGRTPRDPKHIPIKNLASIIEARMQDIADYVMDEIRSAGYEGRLGAGLVITGGSAGLTDIDTLFKNHTGLDVRIATPELNVDEESQGIASDPKMATAIGILLRGVESEKMSYSANMSRPAFTLKEEVRTPGSTQGEDMHTDDFHDGAEEEKPGKRGWISRMKEKIVGSFDVLDETDTDI